MNYQNERYQKQGIHVINSIFTVKNGVFKVLLINRKNQPFRGMWSLVGGAVYNDETIEDALKREVKEKTGLENLPAYLVGLFSKPNRAPVFRMLAIAYISVIDSDNVSIVAETTHTNNAQWFDINSLPRLAFDHEEIVAEAIKYLRANISNITLLKDLLPRRFTLPEIHKAYESILGKPLDRRNFRKKLLDGHIIRDTGMLSVTKGVKSSKLYEFC